MAKRENRIQIGPSKHKQVENYKQRLKQRRVSGTAGHFDSSFDDTASLPSYPTDTLEGPEVQTEKKASGHVPANLKTFSIIVAIIVVFGAAFLRYGALEKAVDFIQKELNDIQSRIMKIEDEHKRDYRDLNEKYNDYILKNKK